jgi:hypothetical protein
VIIYPLELDLVTSQIKHPQIKPRPSTTEERKCVPKDYQEPYYSLINQQVEATWNGSLIHNENGKFPWTFVETGNNLLLPTMQGHTQDMKT